MEKKKLHSWATCNIAFSEYSIVTSNYIATLQSYIATRMHDLPVSQDVMGNHDTIMQHSNIVILESIPKSFILSRIRPILKLFSLFEMTSLGSSSTEI